MKPPKDQRSKLTGEEKRSKWFLSQVIFIYTALLTLLITSPQFLVRRHFLPYGGGALGWFTFWLVIYTHASVRRPCPKTTSLYDETHVGRSWRADVITFYLSKRTGVCKPAAYFLFCHLIAVSVFLFFIKWYVTGFTLWWVPFFLLGNIWLLPMVADQSIFPGHLLVTSLPSILTIGSYCFRTTWIKALAG